MAKLWAKMMAIFTLSIAHLTTGARFMSDLTCIFVALKIALMTTFKYFLTFVETQSLPSASCRYILLSASARHNHALNALARSIVTSVLAFMATSKLFVTYIVALRYKSSAYNRWLQGSCATRTGLRLAVNNWAFFTKTHMAGLTAFVLSAI